MQTMSAKWGDCCAEIISFDFVPARPGAEGSVSETRRLFTASMCHRFSLIHALALGHLRHESGLPCGPDLPAPAGPAVGAPRPKRAKWSTLARSTVSSWCFSWRAYDHHLASQPLPVLGGLSEAEREQLGEQTTASRVDTCFALVLATINARRAAGGVWVDAPILSRVHQVLSDGNAGYLQACKLGDTPIPFPYAQIVSYLLFIFCISYLLICVAKASGTSGAADDPGRLPWLAPVLSFLTILSYAGLHEVPSPLHLPCASPAYLPCASAVSPQVATILEEPFLHPPNDLPAVTLQSQFNARLARSAHAIDRLHDYGVSASLSEGQAGVLAAEGGATLLGVWEAEEAEEAAAAAMARERAASNSSVEIEGGVRARRGSQVGSSPGSPVHLPSSLPGPPLDLPFIFPGPP